MEAGKNRGEPCKVNQWQTARPNSEDAEAVQLRRLEDRWELNYSNQICWVSDSRRVVSRCLAWCDDWVVSADEGGSSRCWRHGWYAVSWSTPSQLATLRNRGQRRQMARMMSLCTIRTAVSVECAEGKPIVEPEVDDFDQWCMSRGKRAASALPTRIDASPWSRCYCLGLVSNRGIATSKLSYIIIIHNLHSFIFCVYVFKTFNTKLHRCIKQRS